jgi:hypothetical protein
MERYEYYPRKYYSKDYYNKPIEYNYNYNQYYNRLIYKYDKLMRELKHKSNKDNSTDEENSKYIKPEDLEPLTDLDKNRIKMLSYIHKCTLQVKTYKFWVILTNASNDFHFLAKNSLTNRYKLTGPKIYHTFLNEKTRLNFINRIKVIIDTHNIIILFVGKEDKYDNKSPSHIVKNIMNNNNTFDKIKDNISPFKIVLNY